MALTQFVTTTNGRRLQSVGGQKVGRSITVAAISASHLAATNEGDIAVVRIQSNITLSVPITVVYATANGTGTAGVDYTTTNGSTEIPAGERYVDVEIPTALRLGSQGNRTFTLTVTSAEAVGETVTLAIPEATVTIYDVTTPPTVSVANTTVTEGNVASLRVTRTSPDVLTVTFDYATSAGTATASVDYTTASGSGTILANESYVDIPVTTLSREGEQATRAFTFTISNAQQASVSLTITNAAATVTILDSESSAHSYFETLSALPEVYGAYSLRDQVQLNTYVEGPALNTPAMVSAGAPATYLGQTQANKVSYSWQYVYPDGDASSIHGGGNPNGTDASAGTGTWAPKDGARLYIDSSNTATSPYYDPGVSVLDKKPWHYTPCNPREQSLYFPMSISSGKILVVVDKWHSRGFKFGRTDWLRQIKPFRLRTTHGDYWSAAQVGDWPQASYESVNGVPWTSSWGTQMNLLSTEVDDYSTTTANKPRGHSSGDPVSPTGQGAQAARHYNYPWQTWVRHVFEIRMFEPHTAFTAWNTATSVTLQSNPQDASGRWHMMSHWVMTEAAGPTRIMYKRPWFTDVGASFEKFNFNYHTSQDWPTMTGPLVAYARNLVILHNYELPATPEDDDVIFQRPLP